MKYIIVLTLLMAVGGALVGGSTVPAASVSKDGKPGDILDVSVGPDDRTIPKLEQPKRSQDIGGINDSSMLHSPVYALPNYFGTL